jgi:hypothetical protein
MCPPSLLHGGEPKKDPGCVLSICFVLHVAGLNSPLIFYCILEIFGKKGNNLHLQKHIDVYDHTNTDI